MTITSSPPIRTSPIVTTLFSGLNVRLASLYGSVMRSDLLHAVEHFQQPRIAGAVPADGADDRPKRAGRSVHVEAHFHQLRDDPLYLVVAGPLLHHYDHKYLVETIVRLSNRPVVPRAPHRRCAPGASPRR